MRFVKRFIFVVILLVLAFFIYRLISPKAANQLLLDIKTFSNDTIGTRFSLSGEVIVATWQVLDASGTLPELTWSLVEITGDDELLLTDTELSQEPITTWYSDTWYSDTWWTQSTGSVSSPSTVIVPPTSSLSPSTKPATPTSSNGLSTKDKRDANLILQGFGN